MAVVATARAVRLRCEMAPVTITGGDASAKVGPARRVPRRDLIVGLQVMFEAGDDSFTLSHRETHLWEAANILRSPADIPLHLR